MKKVIYTLGLGLVIGSASAQVVNSTKIHVSEGAVVSFGTDVTNNGDISNNGKVHLKGNLKNNAKLVSKGEIVVDGDKMQTVSGTTPAELSRIVVNNDLNLETPLKVNEEVSFRNGIISTNNNSALELSENATHSGASNASHVSGVMRKTGNGTFEFPVGDGTNYRSFESTNSNGTLEAQYVAKNPLDVSSTLDYNVEEISQTEYWVLKSVSGNGKVEVNLNNNDEVAYLKGGVWVKESNKLSTTEKAIFTSGKGSTIKKEIGVWPNPTQGEFNLKLSGMRDTDKIVVDITNQDGRKVMAMKGTVQELRKAYTLPKGLVTTNLTIRVINGDEAMTQSLILNK
jgi:hypothetical protein